MANSNNKTKKRINVIDVIIILLVLALIGTVVYRVYSVINDGSSKKGSNYIVTFECDSEYNTMIEYLTNGKAVYLVSNKSLLGYIYDDPDDNESAVYELVSDLPESTERDSEGADANTESESETATEAKVVDVYQKVRLSGKLKLSSEAAKAKDGDYYTINGRNITVGSTLEVYTNEAVFILTVKSIDKAGK